MLSALGIYYSGYIAIPQVRESETILDSESQAVDSGFQFLSEELGFWIPIVSGIPESKAQEFGFHKQIFFRF